MHDKKRKTSEDQEAEDKHKNVEVEIPIQETKQEEVQEVESDPKKMSQPETVETGACSMRQLGSVHILRNHRRGGGGVSE